MKKIFWLCAMENVIQEGDTTVRQGRRTYYRNTARARLSHQFGKDDSVYAGFMYMVY